MSAEFHIQISLKQGDDSYLFTFEFTLRYVVKNGIQHDISTYDRACLYYVTGQKHKYRKQNKEAVLLANKDNGLEAGAKKSKNMYAHSLSPTRICTFLFCHKNASKYYNKAINVFHSFECVTHFKQINLGKTITGKLFGGEVKFLLAFTTGSFVFPL